MKTSQTLAPSLLVNLFGVHPSGCQLPANTLERGHRSAALLLIAAALATASLLLLTPSPAQAQGGVPLWTNVYYGPRGGDVPVDIAVDSIGDVFVTGNSAGDGTFIDYLTIKYSADGVPLWANRFDRRVDYVRAIAVDSNGDVIVTGNTPDPANNNYEDYTTVRYSSVGDLLWVNFFDGGSRDFASSVAVDGGGNVLVSGESFNPNGTTDTVTIKYSSAGDTLWINRYGPHFYPSPTRIAVDGSAMSLWRHAVGLARARNPTT